MPGAPQRVCCCGPKVNCGCPDGPPAILYAKFAGIVVPTGCIPCFTHYSVKVISGTGNGTFPLTLVPIIYPPTPLCSTEDSVCSWQGSSDLIMELWSTTACGGTLISKTMTHCAVTAQYLKYEAAWQVFLGNTTTFSGFPEPDPGDFQIFYSYADATNCKTELPTAAPNENTIDDYGCFSEGTPAVYRYGIMGYGGTVQLSTTP